MRKGVEIGEKTASLQQSARREFLTQASAATVGALTSTAGISAQPAETRPNILFFFPDQWRYDWTGLNEVLEVETPHLSHLSKGGVSFRNTYTASPLCGPSRAALASGKEYDRCGVPNHVRNDYPLDQPTFYSLLRSHGYHVMGCGKFDLHKSTPSWGIDGQHLLQEWGFSAGVDCAGKWDAVNAGEIEPQDPYMAFLESEGLREVHLEDMSRRRGRENLAATFPTPLPESAYCDNWIAETGLELLRKAPPGKPWFLQVNFAGPHSPWDITRQMALEARRSSFPQPYRNHQLTASEHLGIRQNYAAMISNIDRWLGRYLRELEKRGERERTVIVFSSDHGEMLGDHNRWYKSVPYEPSVGVPLIAAGPGLLQGFESDAMVSLIDLAATFLEVAGIAIPDDMDSRSLLPLLRGETQKHREFLLSGLYGWRLVRQGPYKLILGFDPQRGAQLNDGQPSFDDVAPLLFDVGEDPLESRNLATLMSVKTASLREILRGAVGRLRQAGMPVLLLRFSGRQGCLPEHNRQGCLFYFCDPPAGRDATALLLILAPTLFLVLTHEHRAGKDARGPSPGCRRPAAFLLFLPKRREQAPLPKAKASFRTPNESPTKSERELSHSK